MAFGKSLAVWAILGFVSLSGPSLGQTAQVAPSSHNDKDKANQNTVAILSSSGSSIYTKLAEEIFKILDDRKDNGLRVLRIMSRGAVYNVFDILNLQNV